MSSEPWVADALCAQVGGDEWYPEHGQSAKAAIAICRRCPVTAACLAYALTTNQRHGVWGGRSERQRRALQRTTRKAAA